MTPEKCDGCGYSLPPNQMITVEGTIYAKGKEFRFCEFCYASPCSAYVSMGRPEITDTARLHGPTARLERHVNHMLNVLCARLQTRLAYRASECGEEASQ